MNPHLDAVLTTKTALPEKSESFMVSSPLIDLNVNMCELPAIAIFAIDTPSVIKITPTNFCIKCLLYFELLRLLFKHQAVKPEYLRLMLQYLKIQLNLSSP